MMVDHMGYNKSILSTVDEARGILEQVQA